MSLRRVLRIIGKGLAIGARTAPQIAQIAFPQFAGIISSVSGLVLKAEAEFGAGRGLDKKTAVVVALASLARKNLPPVAKEFGHSIDLAKLDALIDTMVETVVAYHHLVGAFQTKPKQK